MRAMLLNKIVSLDEVDTPLELADLPIPEPQRGEVQIRVAACGVCHTELDEIEGRTPPPSCRSSRATRSSVASRKLGPAATKWRAGRSRRRRLDPFLNRRASTKTSAPPSARPAATPTAATPNT